MSKVSNSFLILLSVSIFVLGISFLSFGKPVRIQPTETYGCETADLSGNIEYSQMYGFYEGERVNIPKIAYDINGTQVLGVTNENRWVEVDLSEQKLFAWDGSTLFLETPISSGLPGTPTPVGEFRIWTKLRATRMRGGTGRGYYNLPNVPYVMFFSNGEVPSSKGYGLHGTYWHNNFGTPRSHGCVNLPTTVARELYFWVDPVIQEGKWVANSTNENPGTRIVIHE